MEQTTRRRLGHEGGQVIKHCVTCVYMDMSEHECTAPSPCVDESWHSWKAKDTTEQDAEDADHRRDMKEEKP